MLTQPLLDKLTQLRLSAFRAALEEQLHNPQYADLPFEDRLGLLVDRECTHRDNSRLQRRLKAARLFGALTVASFSNWLRASGSANTSTSSSSAQQAWGRPSWLALLPTPLAATTSTSATSVPPGSCSRPPWPMPMAPIPNSWTPSPASKSWSSMTGSEIL